MYKQVNVANASKSEYEPQGRRGMGLQAPQYPAREGIWTGKEPLLPRLAKQSNRIAKQIIKVCSYSRKKDDVLGVMKAMRRTSDEKDQDNVDIMEARFYALMQGSWFYPVFNKDGLEGPLGKLRDSLQECWGRIATDKSSRTNMLIKSFMEQVCSEKEDDNKVSLW